MGLMGRFASAMTWADRLMLVGVMISLSVGIVFALTVLDEDPPATSDEVTEVLDEVDRNQELANCRAAINARFDYAFALSALVELNGGEYPQDIPIATRNRLPDVEDLPALLVQASLDKASIATPETPSGPGVLCPLEPNQ